MKRKEWGREDGRDAGESMEKTREENKKRNIYGKVRIETRGKRGGIMEKG